MARNVISEKKLGLSRRHSGAMRDLMKKGKIGEILNEHREQDAFFNELKKHSSGGITKDEFRETLGALSKNEHDSISNKEVSEIGRAMGDVLGKKRVIIPKEEKKEAVKNIPKPVGKKETGPGNKTAESPKSAPSFQNRIQLKDAGRMPLEEESKKRNNDSIIPMPGFKRKPSEKAENLLNDILDKKAA